jgi:hypothetical protein
MKRLTKATGIALVLSLAALNGAHAAQINTTPLNTYGQPVPAFKGNTTPLNTYGQPVSAFKGNTTPLNTYGQPVQAFKGNTTPLNTYGEPVQAFHGNTTPVNTFGQPIPELAGSTALHVNTSPVSTLPIGTPVSINNISRVSTLPIGTPVSVNTTPLNTYGQPVFLAVATTAAGLQAAGNSFSTPNVKATIPTGTLKVPTGSSSSNYQSMFGGNSFGDGSSGSPSVSPGPSPSPGSSSGSSASGAGAVTSTNGSGTWGAAPTPTPTPPVKPVTPGQPVGDPVTKPIPFPPGIDWSLSPASGPGTAGGQLGMTPPTWSASTGQTIVVGGVVVGTGVAGYSAATATGLTWGQIGAYLLGLGAPAGF